MLNVPKRRLKHRTINYFIASVFGAVGTLAFSPFGFWPAAILSLTVLLALSTQSNIKQSALLGLFWGVGLFGSGINWVYVSIADFGGMPFVINIFIVALLAFYLALYPALFSLLLSRFAPQAGWIRFAIAAPAFWQITEYLRGWVLTGFPWLQFGYSQIEGPLKGLAPILGVESITFVLMIISGLMAFSLTAKRKSPAVLAVVLLLICIPLRHINWYHIVPERTAKVALVQGNIPQEMKWSANALQLTLDSYQALSKPYLDRSDIIIWPESAIPDTEPRQQPFLAQLDNKLHQSTSQLITGIVTLQVNPHAVDPIELYNSALVLGGKQPYQFAPEVVGAEQTTPNPARYKKHHLVPFGEYVPLAGLLRPLAPFFNLPMSAFSRGQYQQSPLVANEYSLTTAICYEIVLGEQVRDNLQPESDFLLTLSNDAWFGNSIGPWQHFEMARMRALELGRPLLRATNNGITAVVAANGDILKQLPQFSAEVLFTSVTATRGETPYAQLGYLPLWLVTAIFALLTLLFSVLTRRPDSRTQPIFRR